MEMNLKAGHESVVASLRWLPAKFKVDHYSSSNTPLTFKQWYSQALKESQFLEQLFPLTSEERVSDQAHLCLLDRCLNNLLDTGAMAIITSSH